MKIRVHIITSASLAAATWAFTRSFWAGALCFVSGGLIDIDHFLDYGLNFGWKNITPAKVAHASMQTARISEEGGFKKVYLFIHSTELLILLWIIYIYTKSIYVFAIAFGFSVHLAMDQIGNGVHPLFYFVVWRVIKNWDAAKLFNKRLLT